MLNANRRTKNGGGLGTRLYPGVWGYILASKKILIGTCIMHPVAASLMLPCIMVQSEAVCVESFDAPMYSVVYSVRQSV